MYELVIFNVPCSFLSPKYKSFRQVMRRQCGTCFTCLDTHNRNLIIDQQVEQHSA